MKPETKYYWRPHSMTKQQGSQTGSAFGVAKLKTLSLAFDAMERIKNASPELPRMAVMSAPPGYGKTTALSTLAGTDAARDVPSGRWRGDRLYVRRRCSAGVSADARRRHLSVHGCLAGEHPQILHPLLRAHDDRRCVEARALSRRRRRDRRGLVRGDRSGAMGPRRQAAHRAVRSRPHQARAGRQ